MKPTTEQVLAWAREAGYTKVDPTRDPMSILERFAALAYAAGAAAMKERAAKVCDGWGEAVGVHLPATIRALGENDEPK